MREFLNGAEAIVRGAIDAGCTFFAGYPITPATPILLHMARELPKVSGVAIQAEDEIAAMGFCIGATMAGARALTATSGPGISLYSENIGLAIMGEVPMVIVDCQRMGPATGAATTTAQGDIQFLRWGTSGGYPLIVLCPTSVSDCYNLTRKAFDLAERFRLPVILATDKETVAASQTVDLESYEEVPVRDRRLARGNEPFEPYHVDELADIPLMAHFGGPQIVRFTTSTHDERGYLSKDPQVIRRLNQHLEAKVNAHLNEIVQIKIDLQDGAKTLFISYGITARSMDSAIKLARKQGKRVSAATIYSLWPVPEEALRTVMSTVKRIVVAELNMGQYRREIERLAHEDQEVIGVNRIDGELISPVEILDRGGLL